MRGLKPFLCGLLLVIGLLLPKLSWAGGETQAAGARRVGLGFAYTGVRGDLWTIFLNPAGIAGLQQMEAGAFVERRFILSQLNYGTLAFATPFKNDKHFAGFDVSAFGFGDYSEARLGLTYATTLFQRISLGAKVNYTRLSIQNYGAKSALSADVGLNCILSKHVSIGFSVFNASRSELIRDENEKIPTTLDAGLAYQVSDKVLIVADVQKQVNFPTSFRGGVEYAVSKHFKARIGASSAPVTASAGFGVVVKGLNIDFANTLHQYLGYTPSFSLSYRIGKKAEEVSK
jgi:hypothetical protein